MDNLDASVMDKSMRSVFVGNIPYEATEEKLKDIFGEVGQVLSFKLVFDRETGKPKGYGFCEYRDKETALSAMRNLNSYEIGGRNLRVDNACTEKSRMEMQNLMNTTPVESPYGEPLPPEQVLEAISKVVASMPPEQMYELIKQMKECMQNNPIEARRMLLENPQLSYALLQALVIMKILDPQTASSMLHPKTAVPALMPHEKPAYMPAPIINSNFCSKPIPLAKPDFPVATPMCHYTYPPHQQQQPAFINHDIDLRSFDVRGLGSHRLVTNHAPEADQDMRSMSRIVQPNLPSPAAENFRRDVCAPISSFGSDPRLAKFQDPRQKSTGKFSPKNNPQNLSFTAPLNNPLLPQNTVPVPLPNLNRPPPNLSSNIENPKASDQEKAALIMQVLQLSDDQISMLPPDQRNSILVLKGQIAKSSQR